MIYDRATGRRIGRNVPSPSQNAAQERREGRNIATDRKEKRHPFILACLRAANVPRYSGLLPQRKG